MYVTRYAGDNDHAKFLAPVIYTFIEFKGRCVSRWAHKWVWQPVGHRDKNGMDCETNPIVYGAP